MKPVIKPVVYIASPYTKGDMALNVRYQMEIWDKLYGEGHVLPVAPLWSHFQHLTFPRGYEEWLRYCLQTIPRYDACFARDAEYGPLNYEMTESSGRAREISWFQELGKPVFADFASLYDWAARFGQTGNFAWMLKQLELDPSAMFDATATGTRWRQDQGDLMHLRPGTGQFTAKLWIDQDDLEAEYRRVS